MSIQEKRLEQIAIAIQEKEGSTEPITATDFADRIRNMPTSGGGVEVLEEWNTEKVVFPACIQLADLSVSPYTVEYEILEGYN